MLNYWIMLLIFCGVAAVMCAIGFKKFVWFLSVGYGLAVLGLGISYAVTGFVTGSWDFILIIQAALFIIYGFRLAGFLLIREIKNASYRKVLKEATKEEEKPMPFFVMFTIWVFVAILYVMQTSPVFDRIFNGDVFTGSNWDITILPLIGCAISCIGIILESLADSQKSSQKKENPHMVATKGLYRMCRCPNYFGEITFWTGVFVSGICSYNSVGQWILAVVGYICIVYIMINGAQRLDRRQEKNYGKLEEYRKYADHTPIIIPLIPISHIGKYKEEEK